METTTYTKMQLEREARASLRSEWLAARQAGLCKGRVPRVEDWSVRVGSFPCVPCLIVGYSVGGEKRTLTVAI